MEKMGLDKYCIPIEKLALENLENTFDEMCNDYSTYKEKLREKHIEMKEDSHKTTEDALALLER